MGRSILAVFSLTLVMLAASQVSAQNLEAKSPRMSKVYRLSQAFVIGNAIFDGITTTENLGKPLRVTYQYCLFDDVCRQIGRMKTFEERGLAGMFGANRPATVAASAAVLDAGILLASHFMYEKGGAWRLVAIGLNFTAGSVHARAALGNRHVRAVTRREMVPPGAINIRWD